MTAKTTTTTTATTMASSSSSPEVQMIEQVTTALTRDGILIDVKELLKLMDICTCAAAEKHTGVQCVTVSMGDVVFEYLPICGEWLELTARPVFAGNTSLDISLDVVAVGTVRRMVCEAIFTYVTTRGSQGEKRPSPPLSSDTEEEGGMNEQVQWDRTIAKHRRALVQVERQKALATPTNGASKKNSGYDMEISEVVLPLHQNHMGHTFGGVVMAWMAKVALAMASRLAVKGASRLLIRSVLRVDFHCGSNVSDHIILRPRVNAIFDKGRSAEVEVRVWKRSISTSSETEMNVGYFYISGAGADVPFSRQRVLRRSSASKELLEVVQDEAKWRRRLLLARRYLLGGLGEVVEWHSSLRYEAPLLTLESVVRMVNYTSSSVKWNKFKVVDYPVTSMEWTPGEVWGHKDTFILRVKGELDAQDSLEKDIDMFRLKRPEWDEFCAGIDVLETPAKKTTSDGALKWDIVRHYAKTPKSLRASGNGVASIVPFCLLRTWQVSESTAVFASQSVIHKKALDVVAQVRPSGWFLRNKNSEKVEVTYIAEHDLGRLRKVAPGVSDDQLVANMANVAKTWLQRFYKEEDGEFNC